MPGTQRHNARWHLGARRRRRGLRRQPLWEVTVPPLQPGGTTSEQLEGYRGVVVRRQSESGQRKSESERVTTSTVPLLVAVFPVDGLVLWLVGARDNLIGSVNLADGLGMGGGEGRGGEGG